MNILWNHFHISLNCLLGPSSSLTSYSWKIWRFQIETRCQGPPGPLSKFKLLSFEKARKSPRHLLGIIIIAINLFGSKLFGQLVWWKIYWDFKDQQAGVSADLSKNKKDIRSITTYKEVFKTSPKHSTFLFITYKHPVLFCSQLCKQRQIFKVKRQAPILFYRLIVILLNSQNPFFIDLPISIDSRHLFT